MCRVDALPLHDGEWVSAEGHWHHSNTLLARPSSVGAKSSAFAVRRLVTSSNMEHCSIGPAPPRMRLMRAMLSASMIIGGAWSRMWLKGTRITCSISFIQLLAYLGALGMLRAPRYCGRFPRFGPWQGSESF